MKALNTKKEIQNAWNQTVQAHEENTTIISIAEDMNEELIVDFWFKQRNGKTEKATKYPSREQIIDFVNKHHLDMDPEKFMEELCFDEEEIGHNWYLEEPYLIHYFWGESCYGFGGNQDEEDPHLIHFPYNFAIGGPNEWLQYTVKAKQDSEGVLHIEMHKAEYGHSWWGQGGVIDITDDPNALKIYTGEFEERIGQEIWNGIDNGSLKILKE